MHTVIDSALHNIHFFYEYAMPTVELPSHVLVEPFQVRFHPIYPEILASGSLDHEVRLWDANTAQCIGSRDFCNYPYGSSS